MACRRTRQLAQRLAAVLKSGGLAARGEPGLSVEQVAIFGLHLIAAVALPVFRIFLAVGEVHLALDRLDAVGDGGSPALAVLADDGGRRIELEAELRADLDELGM